ncbi:dihydropteroate synthase [Ferrimicrobium acidiphilum]|uniref:Dihydropteroate synthase n=2 Tax=Ferrimicrobium acidiphilum TaxID=121039 RepID=A0A0D8FU35_9ACTN|nr:dihydropteroate synthase [Ferrimicrobium acidiphilum]KJE76783.1 dihydropteroate synthase [Ferrimicrobium acidiphilum DSM 19497]
MRELRLKGRSIGLARPIVMGILNRTTDSFYDKGTYFDFDRFLEKADELVAAGADILDIGGVKAGPGDEVTLSVELDRVVPAVEAVASRLDVAISVDTWRSEVLDAVLDAGAHLGNDISGFGDPDYTKVAARHGAGVVATHIRLKPRVPDPNPVYDDLVANVRDFLLQRVDRALRDGVDPRSVIVDAGFDLGKTTAQSLLLLNSTKSLVDTGYPVLISASNKGFIGETLGLDITERRLASIAAASFAMMLGAVIFRVHDVLGTVKALDTIAALRGDDVVDRFASAQET